MLLDQFGKPMQDTAFEDYKWDTTDLHGDSDQVLTDAFVMDYGKAVTTTDLATAGRYPLHSEEGVEIFSEKNDAGQVQIVVNVMPYRWDNYWAKVQAMKDKWNDVKGEEKPWYHLEGFVIAILTAIHDVHPMWDEAEFEKVLWREMPDAWISPEFAPKL